MTDHPSGRGRILRKLRKIHGWLGLWGALMGLAFGSTGILLNHRNLLKLPVTLMEKTSVQIAVPAEYQASPEALQQWLVATHGAPDQAPPRVRKEEAATVLFDGRVVEIPARWMLTFNSPQRQYVAEYWAGSGQLKLEKQDNGVLGTMTRLHKGYGVDALWVLLIDTFAGALILLSLSGLLLWTRLELPRVAGVVVALAMPALVAVWWFTSGL